MGKSSLIVKSNLILGFGCLLSICSCRTQTACNNCGIVISKFTFFEPKLGTYVRAETYGPDTKVWYKDSIMIQKRVRIYFESIFHGPEKRRVELLGYTFIDLPNRAFYHYKTFSDTAKLVAKWTQPDSIGINNYGGVWNFYGPRPVPVSEPPQPLSDTIKGGIVYKRLKFINANDESNATIIGYLRCDKKGTIVQYDKQMSERIGCPIVRLEALPTAKHPYAVASEIEFTSDKLTPEELKVFAAWEKNAKANPVKK